MTHVEERLEAPHVAADVPAGLTDRVDRMLAQDLLDALWLEDRSEEHTSELQSPG